MTRGPFAYFTRLGFTVIIMVALRYNKMIYIYI